MTPRKKSLTEKRRLRRAIYYRGKKHDATGSALPPGIDLTDLTIHRVTQIANSKGYVVLPKTKRLLRVYLNKAQANKLIKTDRDLQLGASALVTVGIEAAKEKKVQKRRVLIGDINRGYIKLVREVPELVAGPGNHRPDLCLLRTVIERETIVRKQVSGLNEFIVELEDR